MKQIKRFLSFALCLVLSLGILGSFVSADETDKSVDVMFVHDTHSHLNPFATVEDGKTTVFTKVRTKKKAINKIIDTVLDQNSKSPIKGVVVHHINCKTEGQDLANKLKASLGLDNIKVQSIGPIIGLHVGPGSIGVAYHY